MFLKKYNKIILTIQWHSLTILEKKLIENIVGKGKMLTTSLFPFPTMFCTLSKKKNCIITTTLKFVVCNCFEFGHS